MNYIKYNFGNGVVRWYADPETWLQLIIALEQPLFLEYDPNAPLTAEEQEELNKFL